MNDLRNIFLTKLLGYELYIGLCGYVHPDRPYFEFSKPVRGINFSSWEGFGELFEFCQKQEWYSQLEEDVIYHGADSCGGWFDITYINPDKFADTVYEFLKENN
jgi:hypothetical protein